MLLVRNYILPTQKHYSKASRRHLFKITFRTSVRLRPEKLLVRPPRTESQAMVSVFNSRECGNHEDEHGSFICLNADHLRMQNLPRVLANSCQDVVSSYRGRFCTRLHLQIAPLIPIVIFGHNGLLIYEIINSSYWLCQLETALSNRWRKSRSFFKRRVSMKS